MKTLGAMKTVLQTIVVVVVLAGTLALGVGAGIVGAVALLNQWGF